MCIGQGLHLGFMGVCVVRVWFGDGVFDPERGGARRGWSGVVRGGVCVGLGCDVQRFDCHGSSRLAMFNLRV